MNPAWAVVTHADLTGGALGAYVVIGAAVAVWLERRGHPRGAVLGALAVWPLLLPLLQSAPVPEVRRGPLASAIDAALAGLERTLQEPLAGEVRWAADTDELRAALLAADARLALVDRLLADTPSGQADDAVSALRAARADGERAIHEVLAEVQQIRLQVGLHALAGGREPLQQRLRELSARAAALSELG
jgi:hypothetical protein